uniref:Uncharacterized protein n=1 Tax=Heterorhabditis bacteriophora TaxID=37862 RepID=A0A1I7WBC7_HETBA
MRSNYICTYNLTKIERYQMNGRKISWIRAL